MPYQKENIEIKKNVRFPLKFVKKIDNPYNYILEKNIIQPSNSLLFGSLGYALKKEEIERLNGTSLAIYQVSLIELYKVEYENGVVKTKARFMLGGEIYNSISVTDPKYFYFNGNKRIENCLLVCSLPNKIFNDKYFKFIANIIPEKIV